MRVPFMTRSRDAIVGEVDLERTLRAMPASYTNRGMFFERQRTALGSGWPRLRAALSSPPERTYAAFESYPMSDYFTLLVHVAQDRFGKAGSREGVRLLARGEVEVFAASTLGKVTLAMLRDPAVALLRYPDVAAMLVRGPTILAKRADPRTVTMTFMLHHGMTEYTLGVLEGIVLAFDEEPTVQVSSRPNGDLTFVVSW